MLLAETLEIALSPSQLEVNFIDSTFEETGKLMIIPAFLCGFLGCLVISFIFTKILKMRL